ncbi:hypothetical protein [Curtobacterium luteum]|uniref:Uncharacterized protein n=1 Tax=Curtobacterium luteum TaxID=33881 RepID=A0A175S0I4_9MICO|nr:hypothetical protein [Curtobacterium luteum]KTR09709.1 hypothetical protein NS184_02475 [Curtobacterium luteum]
MELGAFDTAAGAALLFGMPAAVLFVAAALRRLGVPRWVWGVFALSIIGVLVLLDVAGHVRYPVPDGTPIGTGDFGQFVGLALGRVGVAVNGAVCVVVGGFRRPARPSLQVSGREARVLSGAYLGLAAALVVPVVSWSSGLGLPSPLLTVPLLAVGVGLFVLALALRLRRLGLLPEDDRPSVVSLWPADAVVGVLLTALLVGAVGSLGGGAPDRVRTVPDAEDRRDASATPDPDWPGPVPTEHTTLDATAVESGTRAALADSVRWAGPLDDLSSPTPARASAPGVSLTEERCDGGVRWTGSLVLPSVAPQDVAGAVQRGWERSGYAVVDRAMGTDFLMPMADALPVRRMSLGGGQDGVHVDVESFCVPR